jgi:hypothetical protein
MKESERKRHMKTKPLFTVLAAAALCALALTLAATPALAADLDVSVGAKFTYKYFPDTQVYFDPARGLYFYMKGENWQTSVSLPGDVRLDPESAVTIEEDTDKPYLKHSKHKKKYPPGLAKKGWKRGRKSWHGKKKRGKW